MEPRMERGWSRGWKRDRAGDGAGMEPVSRATGPGAPSGIRGGLSPHWEKGPHPGAISGHSCFASPPRRALKLFLEHRPGLECSDSALPPCLPCHPRALFSCCSSPRLGAIGLWPSTFGECGKGVAGVRTEGDSLGARSRCSAPGSGWLEEQGGLMEPGESLVSQAESLAALSEPQRLCPLAVCLPQH